MSTTKCPGARWVPGTGNPVCPVCRRGWRSILGVRDRASTPRFGDPIPIHTPYP